jgi:4-amino-4-deoxy-L-arabinose transferase-like glycosyltransferase
LVIRLRIHKSILLLFIPLVLSAFTHIWNPIGFPHIDQDEGHYMRRAMQVIEGQGPQESNNTYFYPYDHPYFGQLFLGGVLKLIGYPDSLSPKAGDVHSIEMLYLVPRVIMGLLAVVDTFLIYKIAEYRYNRNIAFIAAILFAVMPLSWILRRILLESIQLPFLLSSILFLVYKRNLTNEHIRVDNKDTNRHNNNLNIFTIVLSGIFLGLAIFTKLPAFLMIPVVAYLVYTNSNNNYFNNNNNKFKNIKVLALWFIPVILIPMIWPAYATLTGHFDEWVNGVLFQASRESGKDLRNSINIIFQIDAVLLLLAFVAFIYSELRNSFFIFLWVVPYLIFLSTLGWVVHFHWILLIPAFCIAIGVLIEGISKRIKRNRVSQVSRIVIISIIGIFGLTSTYILITSNLNSSYFELYSFISQDLQSNSKADTNDGDNNNDGITVIGTHRVKALLWVPVYVFNNNNNIFFRDTDIGLQATLPPIETKKILLIVDNNLRDRLVPFENIGSQKDKQISSFYQNAQTSATFINKEYKRYPYMTMKDNYGLGSFVEVRSNYN